MSSRSDTAKELAARWRGWDEDKMTGLPKSQPNSLVGLTITYLEASDERIKLIRRAASKIGGDWSGTEFDGRDVEKWITIALDGTDDQVKELLGVLTNGGDPK